MKTTYNRTLTISNEELKTRKIKIRLYKGLKYVADEILDEITYTGLTSWDIIEGGDEAAEIERESPDAIDEYHEYLVLHFGHGERATFLNSHVTMFIM